MIPHYLRWKREQEGFTYVQRGGLHDYMIRKDRFGTVIENGHPEPA